MLKQIWSALLCAVLISGLLTPAVSAAAAGYTPGSAQAFTLSAAREQDKSRTNTVRETGAAAITALEALLGGAGKEAAQPAGATELAQLSVEQADGASAAYGLVQAGDSYYLRHGSSYQPVDYRNFDALAKQAGFYKYYALPTAAITVDSKAVPLQVHSQQYSYRSLSGAYYRRVAAPDTVTPSVPAGTSLKKLSYSLTPDSVTYTVYKDGAQVWTGSESQIGSFQPQAGTGYLVRVGAKYNDSGSYRGTVEFAYAIGGGPSSSTAGGMRITAEGSDTYPGEIVVLKVTGAPAGQRATAVSSVEFTPTFFQKDADTQIALLPVSVYVATGKHWVDVSCAGETTRLTFHSKEKKFEVQHLTVAASTAEQTILSQKANAEYEKAIAPIRPIADDTQYWDGRFIMPVSDKNVTTSFGLIRYTNGSSTPGRHNALDLAVPRGTSVAASGNGQVIYSGFLQLTGNTVVIEHGYGLKSWHYHMDSRNVSTGDMVAQGESIGTVGSTGFSTGPHLHFSMSVGGVFVNPYTQINTDLLNR